MSNSQFFEDSVKSHLNALADSLNYRPHDFEYDVDNYTLTDKKTKAQWEISERLWTLALIIDPEDHNKYITIPFDPFSIWAHWKHRHFVKSWKYWFQNFHKAPIDKMNAVKLNEVAATINSATFA